MRTTDGVEHPADVLIYGTGFSASDFVAPMRVRGRGWGRAQRGLAGRCPGLPRAHRARLSQLLLALRAEHQPGHQRQHHRHGRVPGALHRRGARRAARAGAPHHDCRSEVHDRYGDEMEAGNATMAWGVAEVPTWYRNAKGRVTQNWPFDLHSYWARTRPDLARLRVGLSDGQPELAQMLSFVPADFADPAADYLEVRATMAPFHGHAVPDHIEVRRVSWAGCGWAGTRTSASPRATGWPSTATAAAWSRARSTTTTSTAPCWPSSSGLPVVLPDYRLAPEHPYPAAHDDCLAAYRALVRDRHSTPPAWWCRGDSCGGGLGLGTLIAARAEGPPWPPCFVSVSGWFDLSVARRSTGTAPRPVPHARRGCATGAARPRRTGSPSRPGGVAGLRRSGRPPAAQLAVAQYDTCATAPHTGRRATEAGVAVAGRVVARHGPRLAGDGRCGGARGGGRLRPGPGTTSTTSGCDQAPRMVRSSDAQAIGVGQDVERDDLPTAHGEGADRERHPVTGGHGPGDTVDERRLRQAGRAGRRPSPGGPPRPHRAPDQMRSRRPRPAPAPAGTAPWSARRTTSGSSTRQQGLEVAVAGRGQERVDDLPLRGGRRRGRRRRPARAGVRGWPAAGRPPACARGWRDSSNGTANMSCSTNASRSAGTACRARPGAPGRPNRRARPRARGRRAGAVRIGVGHVVGRFLRRGRARRSMSRRPGRRWSSASRRGSRPRRDRHGSPAARRPARRRRPRPASRACDRRRRADAGAAPRSSSILSSMCSVLPRRSSVQQTRRTGRM